MACHVTGLKRGHGEKSGILHRLIITLAFTCLWAYRSALCYDITNYMGFEILFASLLISFYETRAFFFSFVWQRLRLCFSFGTDFTLIGHDIFFFSERLLPKQDRCHPLSERSKKRAKLCLFFTIL